MDEEQYDLRIQSYSHAVVNQLIEGSFAQAEELEVENPIGYVSSILGTCLLISINQLVRKCDEQELRMIQRMFEAAVDMSKETYLEEEQDGHTDIDTNRTPDRMDNTPTVLDD